MRAYIQVHEGGEWIEFTYGPGTVLVVSRPLSGMRCRALGTTTKLGRDALRLEWPRGGMSIFDIKFNQGLKSYRETVDLDPRPGETDGE